MTNEEILKGLFDLAQKQQENIADLREIVKAQQENIADLRKFIDAQQRTIDTLTKCAQPIINNNVYAADGSAASVYGSVNAPKLGCVEQQEGTNTINNTSAK